MDVWHKRFGHVSPKTVKFIFDNDAVTGMEVKGKESPHTPECKCSQCMQLKAKRVHIGDFRPDREHHATQVGETLHCDLHGPMPISITTGASYYMSVIDEASRWSLIYFLEHKDDAVVAMKQAIDYFAMHGHIVKNVQTDGGGEFGGAQETSAGRRDVHGEAEEPWCRTTEWNEMLTSHKVFHRITPAHVKELNGIAESYNRTLLLLGNALLFNGTGAPMPSSGNDSRTCHSSKTIGRSTPRTTPSSIKPVMCAGFSWTTTSHMSTHLSEENKKPTERSCSR